MKKAYFRIDNSPNFYEGIDTEILWNGWAMPLFSKYNTYFLYANK